MPQPIIGLLTSPYLLLTATSLMWGGNAIAGKAAVGEISPMVLTFLRWGLVSLGFLLIRPREVLAAWRVLRPRWRWVVLMGASGYTLFNALLYGAAHHTSAVNIAILQGSIPIFILLGGLAVFGTRVGGRQWAGALITVIGVVAVASGGDVHRLAALAFNLGDLFMIAACLLYAGYTQGLRDRPELPGLALFPILAIAATIASVPLVLAEAATGTFQAPTLFGWLLMAYVAIGPSFLSQVFFMRGVEALGPGRAGLFVNLVPVFGALLAVALLGEPFGTHHALALALVLGGIVLAETARR